MQTAKLIELNNAVYSKIERIKKSTTRWQPGWSTMLASVDDLCSRLAKYAEYKLQDAKRSATDRERTEPARDPASADDLDYFETTGARHELVANPSLRLLAERLSRAEPYEPVLIDDAVMGVPETSHPSTDIAHSKLRRDFMNALKTRGGPCAMRVHVFHSGGPHPDVRQAWRLPLEQSERSEIKEAAAVAKAVQVRRVQHRTVSPTSSTLPAPLAHPPCLHRQAGPKYSSRALRREFQLRFAPTGTEPALLREMHSFLTGDASAAHDGSEEVRPFHSPSSTLLAPPLSPCCFQTPPTLAPRQAVTERVRAWLDSGGDPAEYWDLRELKESDGEKFVAFWEECAKYLELEVGTGAEERRTASDGSVSFASSVISVPILIREVAKRLHAQPGHEQDPIPSRSCVELQFHPRCPAKLSAGRFTGRLKVRREVQSRILRKSNPDAHACNALAKYCKTKTVMLRDLARELDHQRSEGEVRLASLILARGSDDKEAMPFGPPGLPISSGVKTFGPVLTNIDSKGLLTLDHDAGRAGTLTISVDFDMAIPETAADSWFNGIISVALRDSTFEPSNGFRHAAQMLQSLRALPEPPLYLSLETDRGSDHNSNHLVNKLAMVALQRCSKTKKISLRHPAGGQSFSLTHERCMAILNLGVQHISSSRGRMSEELEAMVRSCNSMAAIRHVAGRGPPPKSMVRGKSAKQPEKGDEGDEVSPHPAHLAPIISPPSPAHLPDLPLISRSSPSDLQLISCSSPSDLQLISC